MRKMSSFRVLSVLSVIVAGAFGAGNASAAHTRVTYPSALSIEVLGRNMLYSIGFDQVVNDNIAAGVGFGTVSMIFPNTDVDANKTATFVPVYMNYYFMKEGGTPYVTGGVTLITNHSSVKNLETSTGGLKIPTSSVMPVFGAGYENRGDTGFLFRVTGYAVAGKSVAPWVGFTFGYVF
jgi:hypothetical protein